MKTLFVKLYIVFIGSIFLFAITVVTLSSYQDGQLKTVISQPAVSEDIEVFFDALPKPVSIEVLKKIVENFSARSKKKICILNETLQPLLCKERLFEAVQPYLSRLEVGSRYLTEKLSFIGPYQIESDKGNVNLIFTHQRCSNEIKRLLLALNIRKHTNAIIIPIAFFVCIIPWLFISHRFSSPLFRLSKVIHSMKKENFSHPITKQDIQRNDGIGELASVLANVQLAMKKTQDANKDLVSCISHELHTPLARITLAIGLIAKKAPQDNVKADLESIEEDCRKIEVLGNELMDLSRLASGRTNEDMEEVHLNKFFEEILLDFISLYEQRGLVVKTYWHVPVVIDGYPKELKRLIKNVLDNVFKYAVENTRVEIRSFSNKGKLCIKIRNQFNLRLPKGDLFEPFVHSETESQGHGFGLSYVQKIMLLHHGKASINTDNGEFTIVLRFNS